MTGTDPSSELEYLTTKPGVAGSGRVRYAAAMYFFQAGKMRNDSLEIYRALAKNDDADPLAIAKASGCGDDIEQLIAGKY